MALLCLVITSCSKDDPVEDDAAKYDIDLALAQKNDREMSSEILILLNDHRATLGLPALEMDNEYASAFAIEHTEYMIELKEINHDHFGYRSEGIKYYDNAETVGEIVAYGQETAESVVNAWLSSPHHKSIIEGDYTHTAFGVIKSAKGRYYFTELFYKK